MRVQLSLRGMISRAHVDKKTARVESRIRAHTLLRTSNTKRLISLLFSILAQSEDRVLLPPVFFFLFTQPIPGTIFFVRTSDGRSCAEITHGGSLHGYILR